MRGQVSGANGQRQLGAEPARHRQAAPLIGLCQAIARLDLQRGHALGHQRQRTSAGRREQGLRTGRACRRHGRAYAATGTGDVFVARPTQQLLELLRTLAAIDQVRVAIDQARGDERAAQVVLGADAPLQLRRHGGLGAHPRQAFTLDQQCAVGDPAPRCGAIECGQARVAPQRERVGHRSGSSGV